jgi:hypothetical protein
MKDKNRQFEETGAFLDVMSKREKKRWEKEQRKLMEEEKLAHNTENYTEQSNEIINSNPIVNSPIEEENNFSESAITVTEENNEENKDIVTTQNVETPTEEENNFQSGGEQNNESIHNTVSFEQNPVYNENLTELEKTQKILEVTTEINTVNHQKLEEFSDLDEDDASGGFNPVIPIGISLIFIYAFFIYIAVATDFTNSTFLTINIIILSILTLFFGLTTLSNKKHVNVFAGIDLVIILSYILFNGISIISYDDMYKEKEINKKPIEEKEEQKPVVEEKPEQVEKHIYNCENENSTLNITYNTENQYIVYIKRVEIFNDDEAAKEISSYYKDINGINVKEEGKEITLEFDFNKLDINQYKLAVTKHNDSYRLESDFSYIENNKILADEYKNLELKNLTCSEIRS